MAVFKVVRDALPPVTVAEARPLIAAVAARTEGKFSFVSNDATPGERRQFLGIVETFLAGPAAGLFRTVHGVEPSVCLSITSVRFQKAEDLQQRVSWHLDLNFIGDDKPFLVAWTAVEEVGVDRIALDICVPTAQTFNLETLLRDRARRERDGSPVVFSDVELDQLLGRERWTSRPVIAGPGTAAVFDQYILHRSQVLPTATKDRYSIEFRMMDPENLPAYQLTQRAVYASRVPGGGLALSVRGRGENIPLAIEDFQTLRIV